MEKQLSRWIVSHPLSSTLWVVIITLIASSGLPFVGISHDYQDYFDADNEQLIAFNKVQDEYVNSDNILVAVDPRHKGVFQREFLSLIEQMTKHAWQVPGAIRVDSLTNYQNMDAEGDDITVKPLFENVERLTDKQILKRKLMAEREPALVGGLLSRDSAATGINITIALKDNGKRESIDAAVGYVRHWVGELSAQHPDTGFYLTGQVMQYKAFPEVSEHDTVTLFPVMFFVMILILFLVFRNVPVILAVIAVLVLSVLAGVGVIGWLNIRLTPDGVAAPAMILPLAIADCVHLISHYFACLRENPDARQAMQQSLERNLKPIFITSVTTALGFLSLNFSDSPPIRVVGNLVAIGVVFALALCIFMLPVLLIRFGKISIRKASRIDQFLSGLVVFISRRRMLLLMSALLLIVVSSFGLPKNQLEQTTVNLFNKSIKFRTDTDWVNDHLTGVTALQYSLVAENGVTNPGYLRKLDKFAAWLRAQDRVEHVAVFSDVIKRLNRSFHGNAESFYRIPASKELCAQYLLVYEASLPAGMSLSNQINMGHTASRVVVAVKKLSSKEVITFDKAVYNWLQANTPQSTWAHGTSPAIMFAYLNSANIKSMLFSLLLALVCISFVLIGALRSVKFGLFSLLPNLAPLAIGFGLWGYFVGQVGLALSVVMGMTLGIIVDDTVHFLNKYLDGRSRLGLESDQAIEHAFHQVGKAIIITSVALGLGFLIVASSDFRQNADLGLMSAVIVFIALLFDLLFMPAALLVMEKRRKVKVAVKKMV